MKPTIKELEKRIKEAVKPYMGMPIALSGGVDSSLLAALIKPRFAISVQLPGDEKYNEIEYAKQVVKHLGIPKHIIVIPDDNLFEESVKTAVKAIGRSIPHFNVFPLFEMYRVLARMDEKELVLGDGPDETMYGYARDLIVNYLYKAYDYPAFENYKGIIDKILPPLPEAVKRITGKEAQTMMEADIVNMRPDMDDMSNGIAEHFKILNHRPYQDNKELDDYMRDLPENLKVRNVEYGKWALRKIAEKYLPKEIAWRKKKVGGPVYPVNILRRWMDKGEFDKSEYMKFQESCLQASSSPTTPPPPQEAN